MGKAKASSSGFSLVEVATTVAVISFALVALIGLLPVGLQQTRRSVDETRAAQLFRMVLSTLESEPFTANPCFGTSQTPPLDLSTLDNTGTTAPVLLFASYDTRHEPEIIRNAEEPASADYQIELRFKPVPQRQSDADGPKRGSSIEVRIQATKDRSEVLLSSTHFLSSLQRGVPPGGRSNSGGTP